MWVSYRPLFYIFFKRLRAMTGTFRMIVTGLGSLDLSTVTVKVNGSEVSACLVDTTRCRATYTWTWEVGPGCPWEVSAPGYVTQSGTEVLVDDNKEFTVVLPLEKWDIPVMPDPWEMEKDIQEALTTADAALNMANEAKTTAEGATQTAQDALDAAGAASTAASEAKTVAEAAQSVAGEAKTAAEAAGTAAEAAQSTADGKIEKVADATVGNVPTLTADGQLANSDVSLASLSDLPEEVSGKADKVVPSAAGNIATLGADGNLADSGVEVTKIGELESDKVDKVADAVEGNLPSFGAGGVLQDSGVAAASIAGKADKVSGATEGNLAGLDASGNLTDSGISPTTVSGKVDKVADATSGNIVSFGADGAIVDSGVAVTAIGGKVDKVSGATEGHLAGLDANGGLTDSGVVAANVMSKVPSPVQGDVPVIGSDGSLLDTGVAMSSLSTLPTAVADLQKEAIYAREVTSSPQGVCQSALSTLFVSRGAEYDSASGTYSLNGVSGITESEMLEIYNITAARTNSTSWVELGRGTALRTNFGASYSIGGADGQVSLSSAFDGCTSLVAAAVGVSDSIIITVSNVTSAFSGCTSLASIKGIIRLPGTQSATFWDGAFTGCTLLSDVKIMGLASSVSFADCAALSEASVMYMVNNSSNGATAITITLHATAFARITEEDKTTATGRSITIVSA